MLLDDIRCNIRNLHIQRHYEFKVKQLYFCNLLPTEYQRTREYTIAV